MKNARKGNIKHHRDVFQKPHHTISIYIDEYKDEEYDDEDDGLWPKYSSTLRSTTTQHNNRQKAEIQHTDELDGNVVRG